MGSLRWLVAHEWSHLLKYKLDHSAVLFDAAAESEKEYYSRDYAKETGLNLPGERTHENFAVHLGETLLMPDADNFFTTAQQAPIRTTMMAKAWLEAMIPGWKETPMRSFDFKVAMAKVPESVAYRGPYLARLSYIADEVLPEARQRLFKKDLSGSPLERLHTSFLLDQLDIPRDFAAPGGTANSLKQSRMISALTNSAFMYQLRVHWAERHALLTLLRL